LARFLVVLAVAAVVAPSSALAAPQTVSILDDGYVPATVTVDRGDIVTWVNNGANLHTVTSDEGTAMESGEMQRGGVFATKFDKAGRYRYHDEVDPKLTGVVVVLDTAQPASTASSAATTEVTPLQAGADDESGGGTGNAVWIVIGVLAVAAAAGAVAFLVARRRRANA
jgi:plastocyanin